MKNKKVLILATSRKTRGGVTAVLKVYEQCPFWKKYKVYWLETHIDRTLFVKFLYAVKALIEFLFLVWFYDIIHIHTSELSSIKRKYVFFKISKMLHKKVIIHLHIGNQLVEQRGNILYQKIFNGADAIIVLSESIRKKLAVLFHIKKNVYVIYNPCLKISSVRYTDVYKEIIFAGTLNKNKGYSVLIRAFAKIATVFPDWKLIIAGNGELIEAKRIAIDCGISERVFFPGWVKEEQKEKLFRRASIFCLASYAEGFPMAVLDAWSYGLPVISTPVGGLPDVLLDKKNVLFFQAGDVDALARQLTTLLSDASLRLKFSAASLYLAYGPFSMSHINDQIIDLYETVVK